jgi:hypothetical protein
MIAVQQSRKKMFMKKQKQVQKPVAWGERRRENKTVGNVNK